MRDDDRPPSACPACDIELARLLANDADPTCPSCGTPLRPVTVASAGGRLLAGSVDIAILALTAGPLHLGIRAIAPSRPLAPAALGLDAVLQIGTRDVSDLLMSLAPLLLISAIYFALFVGLAGQTPGQKLLHLRVVRRAGELPGPALALARYAATLVGFIPGALGWLWMLVDTDRRALHDHVTGTYVVREA